MGTFLPLNLFEQFRRIANIYFLMIICIQLIPGVSPFPIGTSIMPLAFILIVGAIKDASKIMIDTNPITLPIIKQCFDSIQAVDSLKKQFLRSCSHRTLFSLNAIKKCPPIVLFWDVIRAMAIIPVFAI